MKVSEVLRLLADDGSMLDRVRGSHRQDCHPRNPAPSRFPEAAGDLHPKKLNSIPRQAGLR